MPARVQTHSNHAIRAAAFAQPVLRMNDAGPAVKELQTLLNKVVTPVVIDGHFSDRTHRAVHTFQYGRFLTEDGIVGPMTWQALFSGTPVALPTLRIRSQGQEVMWVQEILTRLGVYTAIGEVGLVDGSYGRVTVEAVRHYQTERQLPNADGIVGPSTWAQLSGDRLQAAS